MNFQFYLCVFLFFLTIYCFDFFLVFFISIPDAILPPRPFHCCLLNYNFQFINHIFYVAFVNLENLEFGKVFTGFMKICCLSNNHFVSVNFKIKFDSTIYYSLFMIVTSLTAIIMGSIYCILICPCLFTTSSILEKYIHNY